MPCRCDPERVGGYGYDQWIGTVFADCVYGPTERASFFLGLLSTLTWMVCLLPQLWESYKKKTVDSLSPAFFGLWLLADIANLVGAVWTDQLPTELYEAIFFIAMDVLVLAQFFYYYSLRDRIWPPSHAELERRRRAEPAMFGYPRMSLNALFAGAVLVGLRVALQAAGGADEAAALAAYSAVGPAGRSLLQAVDDEPLCNFRPQLTDEEYRVGHVAAWTSAALYTASRVPQIFKNHRSREKLTLAPVMVLLAVAANSTYFVSILLRVPDTSDPHFYRDTLPFAIGSIGTFMLDLVILAQLLHFRSARRKGYVAVAQQERDYTDF